jgi:transcriptional regulator with XRE-family HTH domain
MRRRVDKSLGRIIEMERVKSGLTQEGLAGACGICRRHLASIEAGANFSVAILFDLARVLPAISPALCELLQP